MTHFYVGVKEFTCKLLYCRMEKAPFKYIFMNPKQSENGIKEGVYNNRFRDKMSYVTFFLKKVMKSQIILL